MCGLLLAFNTEHKINTGEDRKKKKETPIPPVNEDIINQFQDQHTRGRSGFGIITIDPKTQNITLKRATTEPKFLLDLTLNQSPMIIAHHRIPTASKNLLSQTHPMLIEHESFKFRYLIIHNGIVSDENELKEKHEKLGFKYKTEHITQYQNYQSKGFNDSECIAIELALFIEGQSKTIGTDNHAAFIIIQLNKIEDKATRIFFGRNGGDLTMAKTRGRLRISSVGKGSEIKDKILYSFDIKDTSMQLKSQKMVFESYKKPVVITPTKKEFAGFNTNTPNTFHLPAKQEIKPRKDPEGVLHASACECTFCKKEIETEQAKIIEEELKKIKEEKEKDEEEIVFEQDGKTHSVSCFCAECMKKSKKSQNQIIQTKELQLYDEKYTDETVTLFEQEIRNKDSETIKDRTDEALEEQCNNISTIVVEYKDYLLYENHIGEDYDMNFITQIQIYMDTMKELTETGLKAYQETKGIEDSKNTDYNPEEDPTYDSEDEQWFGRSHSGRYHTRFLNG